MILMFTHVPRTAGTTIRATLTAISRAKDVDIFMPSGSVAVQTEALQERSERGPLYIVAGHIPFGIVRGPHATILRDPVDRAVSHVAKFGNNETRTGVPRDNMHVRFYSGEMTGTITSEHLKLARENLSSFVLVGCHSRFRDFQTALLTVCGLPNMRVKSAKLLGRWNKSPDVLTDADKDVIRARALREDIYDLELFEEFRGRVIQRSTAPPA